MISGDVDTMGLDSWLVKKASVMGVALGVVLREEASFLVETVTKLTPPTDGSMSVGQSWAVQKRMGVNAVRGDIGGVYVTSASLAGMIREQAGGEDAAKGFSKAARKGDVGEVQRLLYAYGLGTYASGVVGQFDPSHHRRRRNRRGRVRRGGVEQIVTNGPVLNAYKRSQVKKVGQLKRGWWVAARGLKRRPRLPAWVSAAEGGGSGIFKDMTRKKLNPYLQLSNTSKHGASQNRVLRFGELAVRLRAGKLERSVSHMVRRKWRR